MTDGQANKRRRLDTHAESAGVLASFEEDGEEAELEDTSDTLAALHLLRAEFPPAAKVIPIILRSQIYDLVKDRTIVDRALEDSRQAGRIRVIKLPASVDDYAYVLAEDYELCIDTARLEQKEKGTMEGQLEVFSWFKTILPKFADASIQHAKLISLLGKCRSRSSMQCTLSDSQLAPLLASGLLTRDVGDQTRYLIAVAGAGQFISSITKGRKEIVSLLSRKRYKEAFAKDMHRWKLRGSSLDMRWHLRDLIGRGTVQCVSTPSGQMIRLVKKQ